MSIADLDIVQESVTAAEFTVYTAPATSNFKSAKIVGGLCSNPSTADTELTVWLVKFSGTADLTNQYMPPKVVFAGDIDLMTPIVGAGVTLKAGDFIVTKASVAGNLNVKLSITEKYAD
jgi:hypothetical protein